MKSLMRRASRRRPVARRAASACGALALALSLSACDFIGLDMFPPELMNFEASLDIAPSLAASGLSGPYTVERSERLTATGGESALFVFAHGSNGSRLLVLDPESLDVRAVRSSPDFSRFLGTDGVGNFICGASTVAPGTYAVTPAFYPLIAPQAVDFPRSFAFISAEGGGTYTTLAFRNKTDGMPVPTTTQTPVAPDTYFALPDAETWGGHTSLRARRNDYSGGLLAVDLPGDTPSALMTLLTGVFLSTQPTVAITTVAAADVDRAWLTEGGVVAFSRDRDSRLVRYAYGTGDELDHKSARSDWKEGASFDSSGDCWYYYDRYDSRFYRLRSWWK